MYEGCDGRGGGGSGNKISAGNCLENIFSCFVRYTIFVPSLVLCAGHKFALVLCLEI